MKLRKLFATAAAVAVAGGVAFSAPSSASTTATLSVTTDGALTITEPAGDATTPKDLGSLSAGSIATAAPNALGTVSVSDTRSGILNNNWTATVSATDFVTPDKNANTIADPNEVIPASSIGYTVGTVTQSGGVATGVNAVSLAAPHAAVAMVAVGQNSASWTPTIQFTIENNDLAGTYTGTFTHSAS